MASNEWLTLTLSSVEHVIYEKNEDHRRNVVGKQIPGCCFAMFQAMPILSILL